MYTLETGSPSAPAVVFLHGGPLSSKSFQPAIDLLPELHCLAVDLPEHGQSKDIRPFSLEDSARQVADLIWTRLPGQKAVVVGHSLGGAVALTMLCYAPETVSRALVTGAAARLERWLGQIAFGTLWMYRFFTPSALVKMTIQQMSIPTQYHFLVADDLQLTADILYNRNVFKALMEMTLPEKIACPLLVMVGGQETLPAKAAARKMLKLYPSATGRIAPGLKHIWMLQNPVLFAATVRAWVTDQPLPATLETLK